jgi:hypothetical protein
VAQMIEPRQRWVLACPVLALDPSTNRHDGGHPPRGVLVFYGTETPPPAGRQPRVETCLVYAQQFADQMSHIFNMLELTRRPGATDATDRERVS